MWMVRKAKNPPCPAHRSAVAFHAMIPISQIEPNWVVEFGCNEAVIRSGPDMASVSDPDDLGCPPVRIRRLEEVKIKPFLWDKNGCLRCEVVSDIICSSAKILQD
jgi:hypothetical protein